MKKWNEKGQKIFRKPAEYIIRKLPTWLTNRMTAGIKRRMEGQFPETGQKMEQRAEEFLVKECAVFVWGMTVLLLILIGLTVFRLAEPSYLVFERNSFGEGEKEVSIILQKGEQEKEYTFPLGEQKLSQEEENVLKDDFFRELEMQMAGENVSLQKVNQKLCLEDSLSGWPFYIRYETGDAGYIHLDGSLGEKSEMLQEGETADTEIAVTAEYESCVWRRTMKVQLIQQVQTVDRSPFAKVIHSLRKKEEETREEKTYTIPAQTGDIHINLERSLSLWGLFLFGMVVIVLLMIYHVSRIKNREKLCRKETLRDFPMIVHLLTLYMGAGLSFPSAIHRISVDYMSRKNGKKKYAFEEILRMDTRLKLGEGQQEVCTQWGKRFREPAYQKLSLTLLQVMAKGTREGRALLDHMEREAFRQRLDQAKAEGEEASTKLLFPMILLLGMVMILVMFPAMVRFQGF